MNPLTSWLNPGRWLLYGALLAALLLGYRAWAAHIGDIRETAVHAGYTAAREAENTHNAALTAQRQKAHDAALLTANQRALARQVAADRLAAVNRGLRDDLASQRRDLSGASLDACRQYAATLNTVFGECSAAVEGLAGQAQGHAADALMYQDAWPHD